MRKSILSLIGAVAVVAVSTSQGAQAQDTEFDGTLDCNGNRYMRIPKNEKFDVAAGSGEITVTARVYIRGDRYYGSTRGIICSRWHDAATAGFWQSKGSGFDIHGGESAEKCLSNNVTVDGSQGWTKGLHKMGVLAHSYENTAGALAPGRWAHIAWTFNSADGVSALYVDGELREEVTSAAIGDAPAGKGIADRADILVGGRYKWEYYNWGGKLTGKYSTEIDGDAVWDGKIDDVRFYGKALDAAGVAADKDSGFPLEGFDLIAAYDFENIVGGKVSDLSGNHLDGELVATSEGMLQADKTVTLTAVAPAVAGATLSLDCSAGGTINRGDALAAGDADDVRGVSVNADYRLTYELGDEFDSNRYEFLGLYVNGEKCENPGSFRKAGEDIRAELRFSERTYRFQFKHIATEEGEDVVYTYDFEPSADNIYLHTLTTNHDKLHHFYGHFYIVGDLQCPENVTLGLGRNLTPAHIELYADPADSQSYHGDEVVNVAPGIDMPLFPSGESTTMFTSHNSIGREINSGYAAVPTFTLIYDPSPEGTKVIRVALEDGDVQTGVSGVAVGDLSPEAAYYTLQGVRVPESALAPGIYIVRRGGMAGKVMVK